MMNVLGVGLVAAVLATGQSQAVTNPLYEEIVENGIKLSDGSSVKLPPLTVKPAVDAAAQQAALTKLLAKTKFTFADIARKDPQAPFILNMPTVRRGEKFNVRSVDLWFIAHGDWKTATSNEFLDSFWKSVKNDPNDPMAAKSVVLKPEELAKRGIEPKSSPGIEDRWVFGRGNLFDRVLASATQHGMVTHRPEAVLLANRIDPRFDKDAEYPNQWQSINTSDEGKVQLGEPQPYTSVGSYGIALPLAAPAGAILYEFHMVFEEPQEWFGGVNLVASKLPIGAQDQIRSFRRKLAAASAGR